MEIKYIKKGAAKIIMGLFIAIMITFGASFALIKFDNILNNYISLLLAIAFFVLIAVIKKRESVCRTVEIGETGLVDQIGTLQYQDIRKVICGNDRIEMDFGFANISIKYQEELIKKLQEQGITIIRSNRNLINFERIFMIILYFLGIYFFYNLFVLVFGTVYCIKYNYEIINILGMFIRVLKLISVLVALLVYFIIKDKKNAMAIAIVLVGSFIVWGYYVSIDEEHDYYGNFVCIMEKSELNIYKDVVYEYGILDKTIDNLNGYNVVDLTEREKAVVYYGHNVSGQYIVYREKRENALKSKLFDFYNGKTYLHGAIRLVFDDGKITLTDLNGELFKYDQLKLINGYILEVYQNGVVSKCIIFNDFKSYSGSEGQPAISIAQVEDGKFNLYSMKDSAQEKPKPVKEDTNDSTSQENKFNVISDEVKTSNGEKLVNMMNSIEIETFESNKEFVKIKSNSQDYNAIVLEAAKQFTINNNTDKKIDTQILEISITSGSLDEFGVSTYDRQDIEGEEKIKNSYFYRIKKIGDYYLAARVNEEYNVNVGLTLLDPVITSDTSQTTDFLYRIDGKRYLGNTWGNIGG